MKSNRLHRWVVIVCVLALAACAGGGETGTGLTSSGNDVSVGKITKFGSIWVNGVEFNTGATQVKVEGVDAATSTLRLGMVVTVKGKINADGISGTANQVLVREVIKGPIDLVGASTLTILGQSVLIDDQTVFEGTISPKNISGLVPGDFVEVSGIVKNAGVITATRIDKKEPFSDYKLKGVVSNLNPGATTFSIGTLTINYGGLNIAAGTLVDGASVEIKGSIVSPGHLVATDIESDKLDVSDADRLELEGYVSSSTVATGGNQFMLNNTMIQTTSSTKFSSGLTTDLIAGVYVEVEGALQGGVLTATEVKFKDSVKIESAVSGIGTNSLILAGMPSLTITVDSLTEFDGVADIGSIVFGDHVKVRGRYNTTTHTVTATQIEADSSSSTTVVLQGPVEGPVADPGLTIMGISIDTSGVTSFEGDSVTDRKTFFAVVKSGNVVSVEGTIASDVVTWNAVELED